MPRAKVVVLIAIVPIRIAAMWVIAIWLALQVLGVLVSPAEGEIVSYWGHIGSLPPAIITAPPCAGHFEFTR